MIDDIAWSPPRRRHGVLWIVVSALLLPAGWLGLVFVALGGDFGPEAERTSLADQARSDAVIALVTIGVPVLGGLVLLVRRRRDRSVTLVGPIACIVIAAVGIGTTGMVAIGNAHSLVATDPTSQPVAVAPLVAAHTVFTPATSAESAPPPARRPGA